MTRHGRPNEGIWGTRGLRQTCTEGGKLGWKRVEFVRMFRKGYAMFERSGKFLDKKCRGHGRGGSHSETQRKL